MIAVFTCIPPFSIRSPVSCLYRSVPLLLVPIVARDELIAKAKASTHKGQAGFKSEDPNALTIIEVLRT